MVGNFCGNAVRNQFENTVLHRLKLLRFKKAVPANQKQLSNQKIFQLMPDWGCDSTCVHKEEIGKCAGFDIWHTRKISVPMPAHFGSPQQSLLSVNLAKSTECFPFSRID
jgi:hypothetical protein